MVRSSDLSTRLRRGENLHTEFKAWPIPPDDLAAAIVAFANTDGGQVFLGVDDRGGAVGVGDLDRTTQFVDNVAFNNCSPPVTVLQERVEIGGVVVVAVNVPKGDDRPYRTKRGVYCIRTSSGRRHASREELLRLFQSSESLFYDETPVRRSAPSDLDEDATEDMLAAIRDQGLDVSGIPRGRLLHNWGLVADADGEERLTVAGLLLLARDPQRLFPHACISALRIPGVDISTPPIDQKRIESRLFDMLGDALRFLDFHLLRRHRIRGLEPEVVLEFPVECLREVLVNALAHRDYTVPGPARLLVFDDRVEIRTPGGLPNSVRLDQLPAGVHVLRNPTLYNLLLKRGLVTDAGSGIPRMIRLLREKTGSEPDLRIEGNEFVVALARRGPDPSVAGGPDEADSPASPASRSGGAARPVRGEM